MRIIPVTLGFGQCYLLQAGGAVLVDAGVPGMARAFAKSLDRAGIAPSDVKLIIVTHGHWDHIGSARDIRKLTGARLALHEREAHWLENAFAPMPPGATAWGRILGGILSVYMPFVRIPSCSVDLKLGNEGLSLAVYGIPGKVLHTPGHSSGSVSVLLDSGEAFVGDLAMNGFPLRLTPGFPIFAEDMVKLRESWQLLLAQGARMIYPAHGKPFEADIMRKALAG
jgi:glyoxylase-like metal-dependent hydrolase (beta-lactamase superfamily II)